MRHSWKNAFDLEYNPNEYKSICQKCGLIRMRLSYLKNEETTAYYYPDVLGLTFYRTPKCKPKK